MFLFIELEFVFFRSFKNFVLCFFNMLQFRFINLLYIFFFNSYSIQHSIRAYANFISLRRRRADAAMIISFILLFDCHVLGNSSFKNFISKKFFLLLMILLLEINLISLLLISYASQLWSLCVRWINVLCLWFSSSVTFLFFLSFILSKKAVHAWSSCNFHHIDNARLSRWIFVFCAEIYWIQFYLFSIELWTHYAL